MKPLLQAIRVLSDGTPGHENQSAGLAEALQRRTNASVETVCFTRELGLRARIAAGRRAPGASQPEPQLIIGAGHRTHLPLYFAARAFRARSIVIMKPSLPARMFDLCLVPRHDFSDPRDRPHVLVTRGALNRIPETSPAKSDTGLILVGGPSRHHGWESAPLLRAISEIVRGRPTLRWTLADSRRTPSEFNRLVSQLGIPLTVVPLRHTDAGWLPEQLLAASEAWVTEDSVSMIFEALTARARVGLLPMPRLRAGRLARAVDELVADGFVQPYARWRDVRGELPTAPALHETARCAEAILQRFFPAPP